MWKETLFCVIHTTNPLLPVPDRTRLLLHKQGRKGYNWLVFDWVNGLGLFQGPLLSCELVKLVYPQGAGKHAI
jgi:hypothetical protein